MATFRKQLLNFLLQINDYKFELRGYWPGTLSRQSGALGLPGCQLEAPGTPGCQLEALGPPGR